MKIYIASPAPTDKVLFISKPTTIQELFTFADPDRTFLNGVKNITAPLKNNDFVYVLPAKTNKYDKFTTEINILKNVLNKPKNPSQYPFILLHLGPEDIMVPKGFTALDFLTTLLPPEHDPSDLIVNGIKVLDEENFKFKHDDRIALEVIRCP